MSRLNAALRKERSADGYEALKRYVLRRTGLSYYADRDEELAERIGNRLDALNIDGYAEYLSMLESGPGKQEEFDRLVAELSVGETYFFRHREQWDAMRDVVLPRLIERNRASKRLRIWSAGCSIGAEVYTLSILLRRELAAQVAGWQIQVVGTDINRAFLARAGEGRFDEWSLRSTNERMRESCFERRGRDWYIRPEFREGVMFQYHNLIEDAFPSLAHQLVGFDLILCRNVMIYFNSTDIGRLLQSFAATLVDDGWLVTGSADLHAEYERHFHVESAPGAILYRKKGQPAAATAAATSPQPAPMAEPKSPPDRAAAKAPVTTERRWTPLDPIVAMANEGKLDEAAKHCEERMERLMLDPTFPYYLAVIEHSRGNVIRAESLLRKALYLDRKFALAHYQLGFVLKKMGKSKEAQRAFKNANQLFLGMPADTILVGDENLTVADLARLAQRQLEVLEEEK